MNRISRILKSSLIARITLCFAILSALLITGPALGVHSLGAPRPGAIQEPNRPFTGTEPVTIPFELVTRHIMVKARVNNSRPLSFVFDTGAKLGTVDTEVAAELGLSLAGRIQVGGAGAETLTGAFVKGATWSLPELKRYSQPVTFAIPMGRLAGRFGHDLDGIIGGDFIKEFVVEVDYQKRTLKLYDKDKFNYSGPGESIPIELNANGHPCLDGEVLPQGGESIKGKFVLDLGSGGSLAIMSPVVAEHNLLGNGLKTIRAIGVGGTGGQSTGELGRVQWLQIGKYKIERPVTLFSQDKAGAMATREMLGNIGQQVAQKFKIFLDYSHRRIIFEPNSAFTQPMEPASAGMAFTTEGKDRATVRITHVLENSPAAEAQIQPNDILLVVDGTAASALTVTKLHELFERPQTYKLELRRGDETLRVTLTPRRLI